MKLAIGVASLMFVWSTNVIAQAAPGVIPEVPATPAQGDGAQRQQRPAEELKSKMPPADAAQSSSPSRSDTMRSRERSFPNEVTPPAVRPSGSGNESPAPVPAGSSPMPGLPVPATPAPTPGNRG